MADTPPPKGYTIENDTPPPAGYRYEDPITRMSNAVAPAVGRYAAEALPMIGSAFGPGGTMVGTGVKQILKREYPEKFGEVGDTTDQVADAAKELVLNNLLPAGLSKVGKFAADSITKGLGPAFAERLTNFPAVREAAVRRLTGQIQEHLGEGYNPHFGDYQPVSFNEGQPREFLPEEPYFKPGVKPSVIPVGPIRNALPDAIQAGDDNLSNMVAGKSFDAGKVLEELGGKNAKLYSDAMSPEAHTSMVEMLNTMKGLQGKNTTDNIISYSKNRLAWALGGAAFGHPIGGLTVAGAKSTPIILNSFLSKIMENPETARLVTVAMQTPKGSAEAPLIEKALAQILPRVVQGGADIAATPER